MEPTMGPGEGKADMVVPCTGAGRGELANDRLFRDVMLLSRLLVRSLVCDIRWRKFDHHKPEMFEHVSVHTDVLSHYLCI